MFKEDTKQLYHPHMEEIELYWKSLWEEKVQHNEKVHWIKREEKEKIYSMNWMPIKTTETTLFLSKTHNWKSPGSDQILNYSHLSAVTSQNSSTQLLKNLSKCLIR
jgi:hypothetical protein